MKRIKTLACCCAAACLMMVLAGCSAQQAYTPVEKTPTVTTPTISKNGTLRVGVDAESAPLAGTSSSKIVGLDVDIAAALADQLGLKLEIVDIGKDPESALKDGKVDVVMGVSQTNSEVKFWKSEPYLPTAIALFAPSSTSTVPTKASAPTIAAQVSSASSWQVENEFGGDALVSENDLKSAFADLTSAKVQYVAADAIKGTYTVHGQNIDAHMVALLQQPGGYCVGVLDANTALKQTISDSIAELTSKGIIPIIETKWMGSALNISSITLTDGAKSAKTGSDGQATSGTPAGNTP